MAYRALHAGVDEMAYPQISNFGASEVYSNQVYTNSSIYKSGIYNQVYTNMNRSSACFMDMDVLLNVLLGATSGLRW